MAQQRLYWQLYQKLYPLQAVSTCMSWLSLKEGWHLPSLCTWRCITRAYAPVVKTNEAVHGCVLTVNEGASMSQLQKPLAPLWDQIVGVAVTGIIRIELLDLRRTAFNSTNRRVVAQSCECELHGKPHS